MKTNTIEYKNKLLDWDLMFDDPRKAWVYVTKDTLVITTQVDEWYDIEPFYHKNKDYRLLISGILSEERIHKADCREEHEKHLFPRYIAIERPMR